MNNHLAAQAVTEAERIIAQANEITSRKVEEIIRIEEERKQADRTRAIHGTSYASLASSIEEQKAALARLDVLLDSPSSVGWRYVTTDTRRILRDALADSEGALALRGDHETVKVYVACTEESETEKPKRGLPWYLGIFALIAVVGGTVKWQ